MKVHHVRVDEHEVHVGATSAERYGWELDSGRASAVDATDLVWVTLGLGPPGVATTETIGLFPGRGTQERSAALAVVPALLDAAWEVVDQGLDAAAARRHLIGRVLSARGVIQ